MNGNLVGALDQAAKAAEAAGKAYSAYMMRVAAAKLAAGAEAAPGVIYTDEALIAMLLEGADAVEDEFGAAYWGRLMRSAAIKIGANRRHKAKDAAGAGAKPAIDPALIIDQLRSSAAAAFTIFGAKALADLLEGAVAEILDLSFRLALAEAESKELRAEAAAPAPAASPAMDLETFYGAMRRLDSMGGPVCAQFEGLAIHGDAIEGYSYEVLQEFEGFLRDYSNVIEGAGELADRVRKFLDDEDAGRPDWQPGDEAAFDRGHGA